MNERDIELAKQAGLYFATDVNWMPIIGMEYAEKFANLIRADEREACAKLCDDLAMEVGNKNFIAVDQRKFCAKQIRARGEK